MRTSVTSGGHATQGFSVLLPSIASSWDMCFSKASFWTLERRKIATVTEAHVANGSGNSDSRYKGLKITFYSVSLKHLPASKTSSAVSSVSSFLFYSAAHGSACACFVLTSFALVGT